MQQLKGRVAPMRVLPCKLTSKTRLRVALQEQHVQQKLPSLKELPESLRNYVAVVETPNSAAPNGVTRVYILGVSHVSKVSCEQIHQLIHEVRPEVVLVELDKDRLPLLVDPKEKDKDPNTRRAWHCRKVTFDGLPPDPEWPRPAQLRALLRTRPGQLVGQDDIEGDAITLLSTGLFKSVKPAASPPELYEAPEFGIEEGEDGKPRVFTVPPLGGVRYVVTERKLPPLASMAIRLDSSLKGEVAAEKSEEGAGPTMADLEAVAATAVADSQGGVAALNCYLRARAAFEKLFKIPVAVSFSGVENGKVEALVKAVKAGDRAWLSGLEGSAQEGQGSGIETFRPQRNSLKLSAKMFLPAEALERLRAAREEARTEAAGAADSPDSLSRVTVRSSTSDWDQEVVEAGVKNQELAENPVADAFSAVMTIVAAALQRRAAEKTGVKPGEAWRAALLAASQVGAQQVVLGDRPTRVTERRMADAMMSASGGRLAGALVLSLGSLLAAATTSLVPESAELAGVVASWGGAALLMAPILGPFLEMSQLAGLSGEEIEARVALKQPLQPDNLKPGETPPPVKVFGEDALLDWPGVMEPIIHDRDLYMAKVTAALATGLSSQSPAFVLDRVNATRRTPKGELEVRRQLVWRYRVPQEEAPALAAPKGMGDGTYAPLPAPAAVVAVVGTAHVAGMIGKWQDVLADTDVSALLKADLKE